MGDLKSASEGEALFIRKTHCPGLLYPETGDITLQTGNCLNNWENPICDLGCDLSYHNTGIKQF